MSAFDSSSVSFLKAFFCSSALTATSYLLMCYFPAWGAMLALPHICQVHVHLRAFAFTIPLPWLFHQLSSPPSTQLNSSVIETQGPSRPSCSPVSYSKAFPFLQKPSLYPSPHKCSSLTDLGVFVYVVSPLLVA